MIKLIASDMDGTLLDDESNLPKEMNSVLDFLDDKGIPFVAASGRSLLTIEDKFGKMAKRICIVSDNGAIVKHKGEIIYSSVMEPKVWKQIVEDALELEETSIMLVGVDTAYRFVKHDTHADKAQEFFSNAKFVTSTDEIDSDIIKVTLLSLDNTYDNFHETLNPKYGKDLSVVFGGAIWIDFMNKNVHKGSGLQRLLDRYEVDKDDFMAFGDYNNDLQMLKLANHSYAVGNAHDEIKAIAKTIIGTNNDNAVINTILDVLNNK